MFKLNNAYLLIKVIKVLNDKCREGLTMFKTSHLEHICPCSES